MAEVVKDIAANAGDFSHPLLETHPDGKTLYLVCAADKGLAGAYSSNVFKLVASLIEDKSKTTLVTVGRKARDHFKHRGFDVAESYIGIS